MAKVTSRSGLIDYCLRRLGHPVTEINVDSEQVEDRITDAFDFFFDYHFDGTERTYFSVELTQLDIDNGYVSVPDSMIFVSRALPFGGTGSFVHPMNDPNAAYDFHRMFGQPLNTAQGYSSSTQGQAGVTNDLALTTYYLNMQYYEQIQEMFGHSEVPIRFNRHTNRVYLDTDMTKNKVVPGDHLVLEGWSTLNPDDYPDVYNDRWLKRYATALIKRQWGENLIKYSGITLPGGVTLDGDKIYTAAVEEINDLEEEMQDKYELPPEPLMG